MNVFYEQLPECIEIDGTEYRIITDFREWIRFSDMLKSDISTHLKYEFIREMFLETIPNITEKVFDGMSRFLSMEENRVLIHKTDKLQSKSAKSNISYEYDAPYIISAFLREYNIDLLEIPYLHWWKFKMLLDGLTENSQIKERIYYRDCDINSITDKAERKRVMQIKKRIALPEKEYVSDGDIGNAF